MHPLYISHSVRVLCRLLRASLRRATEVWCCLSVRISDRFRTGYSVEGALLAPSPFILEHGHCFECAGNHPRSQLHTRTTELPTRRCAHERRRAHQGFPSLIGSPGHCCRLHLRRWGQARLGLKSGHSLSRFRFRRPFHYSSQMVHQKGLSRCSPCLYTPPARCSYVLPAASGTPHLAPAHTTPPSPPPPTPSDTILRQEVGTYWPAQAYGKLSNAQSATVKRKRASRTFCTSIPLRIPARLRTRPSPLVGKTRPRTVKRF